MITFVFPGQGSQVKGMGKELFAKFPDLLVKADQILGYSITKLCLEDPLEQLTQTQYTQPALYIVNALSYFHKVNENGKAPDFVTGHSLGEYNALLAADVFNFETGLRLVKKRGELMSQATGGAMSAIVGLNLTAVENILKENDLMNIVVANNNSHTQLVISGKKNEIDRANELFIKAKAMMVVPLKVSGAFHSPLMLEAQQQFSEYLREFTFSTPKIPVIANATAKPYEANAIASTLAQQIASPVRWTESIEYLIAQGVGEFEEIGPGSVLTGLIRRIKKGQ